MRRWLKPVAYAIAVAGLGIAINLATDLRANWWAWVTVAALTLVVGTISAMAEQPSAKKGGGLRNVITGQVSGNAMQARDIRGPVTLSGSRPDPDPDQDQRPAP